jgi:hypothetical protein
MNEPDDPFEAELSALRPHEVSPALRRRVASGLSGPPPRRDPRRWLPVLAGGLAAACLASVLFSWGGGEVGPGPITDPPRPTPAVDADDSTPMLLAYQRALTSSPEDLDALLDKHARVSPGPRPGLLPIRGFTRSDAALVTLLGED